MGMRYQKRIRTGKNSWLNVSKSGVSGSAKLGPLTLNSRGRKTIKFGNGLSYRAGSSGCAGMIVMWMVVAAALTATARAGLATTRSSEV